LFLPNTILTVEHICRMLGRNDGDQPLFALSSTDLISRYHSTSLFVSYFSF
jgi:hypothetical protein